MIRFSCDKCGKKFKAPDELAGRVVKCSACETKIYVPEPLVESSPAEETEKTEEKEESQPFVLETPKRGGFEDLVDMTAMVDIVFFLLIFFMVTSMQGLYSAIAIPPPSAEKSTAKVKKTISDFDSSEYVIVRLDRDNNMFIEQDKIPSEQELRVRLRNAREGKKGTPPVKKLMILGNGDANTVTLVKVIDAGNAAGMDEVQMALDDNE
jgi:biopolymer transport protein ExbD/DNA-directed RNA polymerase subunit RPC12/RpoP